MGISFEESYYQETFGLDKCSLMAKAYEEQTFHFDGVKFTLFKEKYEDDWNTLAWLGRKFSVIFQVPFCGIIKTLYHLAKAIFLSLLMMSKGDLFYFKVQMYHVARDLQESFGWLIFLFRDTLGLYHIQEAQFHKSCYDCFSLNNLTSDEKNAILENYIRKDKLDLAYEVFLCIPKEHKFHSDTQALSKAFANKKEFDRAIQIAREIDSSVAGTRSHLISEFIENAFESGSSREVTLKMLKELTIPVTFTRKAFNHIVDFLFEQREFTQVEKMAHARGIEPSIQAQIQLRLARHYFEAGDFVKAKQLAAPFVNHVDYGREANELLLKPDSTALN